MKKTLVPTMKSRNKKEKKQNNDTKNHSRYLEDRARKEKEEAGGNKGAFSCTLERNKDEYGDKNKRKYVRVES